jgi:hypothetical protein
MSKCISQRVYDRDATSAITVTMPQTWKRGYRLNSRGWKEGGQKPGGSFEVGAVLSCQHAA